MDFKLGMRVKCIKAYDGKAEAVGKVGTIIGGSSTGFFSVEFDDYISGHDSPGIEEKIRPGKQGHCWNISNPEEYLQILGETSSVKEAPLKKGDRVVCIKIHDGKDEIVGKVGTIIYLLSNGEGVCVEYDENIGGHDGPGTGRGKLGHCWVCYARGEKIFKFLQRIDSAPKEQENENKEEVIMAVINKIETRYYINDSEVQNYSVQDQASFISGTQARIDELSKLPLSTAAIEAEVARLKADMRTAVELFNKYGVQK